MRNIDADYYGYMDDDDGLLTPVEEKCEKEVVRKKVEEWKSSESSDIHADDVYDLPEMNVSSFNHPIPSLSHTLFFISVR